MHLTIKGTIVHGNEIGRTLGFPTANLVYPAHSDIPEGVFISKALLEGRQYKAVTHIGRRPTIDNKDTITIEVHLLDYSGDCYGKELEVTLLNKLRDPIHFSTRTELKEQIAKDSATARAYRETV